MRLPRLNYGCERNYKSIRLRAQPFLQGGFYPLQEPPRPEAENSQGCGKAIRPLPTIH